MKRDRVCPPLVVLLGLLAFASLPLQSSPPETPSPEVACPSCDDGNPCTVDSCEAATGTCRHDPFSCDDHDPCTNDFCATDNSGSCLHSPFGGASCDDGNSCTIGDICSAGVCGGTRLASGSPCDDGNTCTTSDTCMGNGVCSGDAQTGQSCDDHNSCTSGDFCDNHGLCAGAHLSGGAPCDDADACTQGDVCLTSPGNPPSCHGTPTSCNDTDPCTEDECEAATGICAFRPKSCDDRNSCTDDSCDPSTGACLRSFRTGTCSDNGDCTTGDCVAGNCIPGSPLNCDDGEVCTRDSCQPGRGCLHIPNQGMPCGGPPPECRLPGQCTGGGFCDFPRIGGIPCGPPCAPGICTITGGTCMFQTNPCLDSNPCTSDTCTSPEGVAVCAHTPQTGPCNDLNPCTASDFCQTGTCLGTPVPGSCNDNNSCTINDTCMNGTCAGTPTGAPQLSVTLSPSVLSPANHQMVPVTLAFTAQTECGAPVTVMLISVTSNQPDDAPGPTDGHTTEDIQGADLGQPDTSILLRAERDRIAGERIYTITYSASANGSTVFAQQQVSVPAGHKPPPQTTTNPKQKLRPKE